MKNKIILFIFTFHVVVNVSAQTTDSLKAKCFDLSTRVKGDWGYGPIETDIITHVSFLGNYENIWICDFTDNWKCYPEYQIFVRADNDFVKVKNKEIFNNHQNALIQRINKHFQKEFNVLSTGDSKECFIGLELKMLSIDDVGIRFSEKEIQFIYYYGVAPYCDVVGYSSLNITWDEILPYLKNQEKSTPNYCTPSGPKVNIRSEPNVKASVNFQLDKGEFFEILEEGKADIVNGKKGKWYKIDYNGKEGYIFSFYTLCP